MLVYIATRYLPNRNTHVLGVYSSADLANNEIYSRILMDKTYFPDQPQRIEQLRSNYDIQVYDIDGKRDSNIVMI